MSLRMKRNLPTLILLALILLSVAIFLGSQPLIAYSVKAVDPAAVQGTLGTKSLTGLSLIEKISFLPGQ